MSINAASERRKNFAPPQPSMSIAYPVVEETWRMGSNGVENVVLRTMS
eukprot:CAMPEP_0119067810 /NCGR_PEP_ID=MMETSP1178-20130426/10185_1 /TAXON_ID=33656 /ORGANISM="unid sp, Strain CCMP2000" /LENGTH=47 /DNA_ID= /DNA_START= /DNA_END= /DNA_ORIENTATION=